MPAHRQVGFQKRQFNKTKIRKNIMKPSSHALAMLNAAYRKILNHDFLLRSQDMAIPQGKTLLSCLAVPVALGTLAFGNSAYASKIYITIGNSSKAQEVTDGKFTAVATEADPDYTRVAGTYDNWEGSNTTNLALTVNSNVTLSQAYGGFSTSGDASDYTLTITGSGTVSKAYGGYVNSGTGSANNNTVNITGWNLPQILIH